MTGREDDAGFAGGAGARYPSDAHATSLDKYAELCIELGRLEERNEMISEAISQESLRLAELLVAKAILIATGDKTAALAAIAGRSP